MKIVIVGAGIGGLAAARALREKHQVVVSCVVTFSLLFTRRFLSARL